MNQDHLYRSYHLYRSIILSKMLFATELYYRTKSLKCFSKHLEVYFKDVSFQKHYTQINYHIKEYIHWKKILLSSRVNKTIFEENKLSLKIKHNIKIY